jgi:Glycosyl hydrolases family 31/N-terminal barrel of NtMGAM and CtMGAM, maltase-glucoamylase/Trefoil (P-type) domain
MQPSKVHLLYLLLTVLLRSTASQQCWFAGPRVDCGFVGITADQCKDQGCCWQPAEFEGAPHIDLPWCFYSNNEPSTYAISQKFTPSLQGKTSMGNTGGGNSGGGNLKKEAILELKDSSLPQLGADIKRLKTSVEEIAPGIVRFRLTDAEKQRWEVPSNLFPPSSFAGGSGGGAASSSTGAQINNDDGSVVDIHWDADPFSLRIFSTTSNTTIFDSTGLRLVFKDQYLELSTSVSSTTMLYGAGERASDSLHLIRNGMPRVLWNQDKGPTFMEQNSYGSYPFVLALDNNNNKEIKITDCGSTDLITSTTSSWGYFMLNSNGMEIIPSSDRLSWRIIGGIVDLFIFAGGTSPAVVLDQLTQVVGRPTLMPYWSLGWQQSKYGYKSIWEVEEVVSKYAENGLPLETIVTDIDHMDRWKDFSFDPKNYPLGEMQRFVAELEKKGQKWVPIVDPGISVLPGYEPYDTGVKEDVFLKEYDGKTNYLGEYEKMILEIILSFPFSVSTCISGMY